MSILQGEKRKMLLDHETTKMEELETQYQAELKEWKSQLRPRKHVSNNHMCILLVIYSHCNCVCVCHSDFLTTLACMVLLSLLCL